MAKSRNVFADERTGVRKKSDYKSVVEYLDVGYPSWKVGNDIPKEYMVKIVSSASKIKIRALLQDKISLRVGSEWAPFSSSNWLSKKAKEIFAFATTRTLLPRFATRRIWQGTTPMALTLPLKFEAEEDARMEVLMPCKELQRMVLPQQYSTQKEQTTLGERVYGAFTLLPPGPNPFSFDWASSESERGKWRGVGDIITIHIGDFLRFKTVIVREVTVDFANKFTKFGLPISATVSVQFETFEILTKDALDREVYSPDVPEGEEITAEPAAKITSADIYSPISTGTMRA